jgi:hypothetical protein
MERIPDDRAAIRGVDRVRMKMLPALPSPVNRWIFRRTGEA